MKKIQTFIYVLLMGVFFTACQEDDFGGSAQGGIRIALADGTAGVDVTTRSTPSELFDGFKEKFKFQIKGDNYDQTHDWTDEVIPLEAGVYDITATCGTEQVAGVVEFDKPCYTGTKEGQKVNAGETATEVSILCEVTNALVSIKFGEEYKEFAEDAYAMIAVGSGTATNWAELSESAYFKAGSSLTKLELYRDGSESLNADILAEAKKNPNFPETFKAGDHLIITLSVAKKDGNVAIKVSKVEVDKVTIEETIPMEWLPKPKVEAEGFEGNQLVMYESETPTAKFNFNLSSGLQELKFTLDFEDETYKTLNKEYVLSTLSESDKQALTGTGVVLPSIGDKGNVSLDFSGLAAKLTGSTDGNALDNVITLNEVKANNRVLEGEQTYTIQTHAPEFGIKVYPGNTWTKQFTANTEITKGNAEAIREGMTFEYSTNGSNWTSSDSIVIGLTPGTAYQVRAKFGKHVTEVAKVSTYPVIELENGNLSDYSIVRGEDGDRWNGHGAQYEWTNWTTLNELTTPNCPITAYSYNTRSGTRPVPDVRPNTSDNTAAWIITIGYGYGGTNDSPNKITPSELVYDKTWENATRPTGVHFWYKYAPFKEDKSDISVIVYSGEQIVGSGTLQEAQTVSSYSQEGYTLNIIYDSEYKQLDPNRVLLTFRSGFNTEVESRESGGLVTSTTANPKFRGSELYIDDISLVYDK